jgi:isopenicillin-N epimerase
MTDRSHVVFGHALRGEWLLAPEITYLNHGTVGATPRVVLDAQRRIQDEIERQPSAFLLRRLSSTRIGVPDDTPSSLREAASAIASRVGARQEDLVFVDNATTGANAVFGSLDLGTGDELAILDLAYGGIARAARFAARKAGAEVVVVETSADQLLSGSATVDDGEQILSAVERTLTPRTRLVAIDHVAAETALVLPVADIAALCRSKGVLTFVDGAHAPGAVALNVEQLGVDFYAANLHKWAWAPRSSGFLWARPTHHEWLHPPVMSWGLDLGFTAEFDWVGTRDPSPFLAAPEGFRLLEAFGAERVRAYNHDLAWHAARHLARTWHTTLTTPESMIGTMATIALPAAFGSTPEAAARLRDALLFEDQIEVQLHAWRDRLWVRVSAQIYNDLADIDRLAHAVSRRSR